MADQIEHIERATGKIRGFRSVETLTIRAVPTLSNRWLRPRLSVFLDQHSDVEIRLDGTNEPTDINQELVDLDLRLGDGRRPVLFVKGLHEHAAKYGGDDDIVSSRRTRQPARASPGRRPQRLVRRHYGGQEISSI
ncbi:hypothetical protein [Pararhizobium antarcticum]|nr:hypothetical protein [Pararhizobium antarcticum]